MVDTPKRPVRLVFVFGKGLVKRRQESANYQKGVVEQMTVRYATETWGTVKTTLKLRIRSDIRAELLWIQAQFHRFVIGVPGTQRGLIGTLQTRAVGGDRPQQSLGSLPRWAPRGARYLEEKRVFTGREDWFDNTGWEGGGGGLLSRTFPDVNVPKGDVNVPLPSGGVFENMFGEITVDVIRNNRGWGVNAGTMTVSDSGQAQLQLATVRVRALRLLTPPMLRMGTTPNAPLLQHVATMRGDEVANRLRGGRGVYRPTLEPFLAFFLERSIPQALNRRLAKGNLSASLYPTRR